MGASQTDVDCKMTSARGLPGADHAYSEGLMGRRWPIQRPCLDCHGTRAQFEDHCRFSRRVPRNDVSTTYDIRSGEGGSGNGKGAACGSELARDPWPFSVSSAPRASPLPPELKSPRRQRVRALTRVWITISVWLAPATDPTLVAAPVIRHDRGSGVVGGRVGRYST